MRGTICLDGEEQDVADLVHRGARRGRRLLRHADQRPRLGRDRSRRVRRLQAVLPVRPGRGAAAVLHQAGALGGRRRLPARDRWRLDAASWWLRTISRSTRRCSAASGMTTIALSIVALGWWAFVQDSEQQASLAFSIVLHAGAAVHDVPALRRRESVRVAGPARADRQLPRDPARDRARRRSRRSRCPPSARSTRTRRRRRTRTRRSLKTGDQERRGRLRRQGRDRARAQPEREGRAAGRRRRSRSSRTRTARSSTTSSTATSRRASASSPASRATRQARLDGLRHRHRHRRRRRPRGHGHDARQQEGRHRAAAATSRATSSRTRARSTPARSGPAAHLRRARLQGRRPERGEGRGRRDPSGDSAASPPRRSTAS